MKNKRNAKLSITKWSTKHDIIFIIIIALFFINAEVKTFYRIPSLVRSSLWIEIIGYIVGVIIIWAYRKYLKEKKLQNSCLCLLAAFTLNKIKRLINISTIITGIFSGIGIFFSVIAVIITVSFLLQSKHEH
jgi:hypothetical protein